MLRAVAAACLLAVEMLAMGVRPAAAGTGEGSLTVVLTGKGSGGAVTSNGRIDCALANGVIVSKSCDWQGVPLFTKVTLTVTANTGSALCDNTNCYSEGATNVYDLTINGDISWNGYFGLQNRYLAVLKSGAGSGSVTSTDGKISCPASCQQSAQVGYTYGDPVTLHAVAASGSAFDGWTGMCAGQGATCTFDMISADTEASTTAAFKVKATPTPAPTHTATPGHTAPPGQTPPPAPTSPGSTNPPGATPIPADPGASAAATGNTDASPLTSPTSSQPVQAPTATAGAVTPVSTPGSLDTGWVAFLLLLVLVIGVSVGGAIAFFTMRRRAPPPAT